MNNIKTRMRASLCVASLSLSFAAAAHVQDGRLGAYVEGGQSFSSPNDTDVLSIGLVMPWSWRPAPEATEPKPLSFYWDFFLSTWRAPQIGGGRGSYTQGGVIATWRWRFDQGQSPWFAEAGLGGTVMDSLYRTPDREFTTTFQFTELLGVGRSFGSQDEHELSLRVQHFSNAGIKRPNPGENFVRVRYLYRF